MTWLELRKSDKAENVCKQIAELYIKYKRMDEVANELNTHATVVVKFMWDNNAKFQAAYPILYKKYFNAKEQSRKDKYKNMNKNEFKNCTKFKKDVLDDLPNKVKYRDFINFILQYNTGDKSVNELIGIAAKKGIKVVG